MRTNKKRKKKYKRIDGVLYEAMTSDYDGRVIGWTKVQEQQELSTFKIIGEQQNETQRI